MLQVYGTATAGPHTLRFGARARAYRDANYSTSGANGSYFFSSVAAYQPCTSTATCQPAALAILGHRHHQSHRPACLLFDGSLFAQDDWRVNRACCSALAFATRARTSSTTTLTGRRALAIAWTPGHPGKNPPKTVIRAGYGWFFNRFILPVLLQLRLTPYIIDGHPRQSHQSEKLYGHQSRFLQSQRRRTGLRFRPRQPPPFPPTTPSIRISTPRSTCRPASASTIRFGKHVTSNITYLYTQGDHQYLTNNVTAPAFDDPDYTITGPTPAAYNYQFQSGGFYRQNQLILSSALQLKKLTLSGNYTLNQANSDTQGVSSFPSSPKIQASITAAPGSAFATASCSSRATPRRTASSSPLCLQRNPARLTTSPSAKTSPATTNSTRAPATPHMRSDGRHHHAIRLPRPRSRRQERTNRPHRHRHRPGKLDLPCAPQQSLRHRPQNQNRGRRTNLHARRGKRRRSRGIGSGGPSSASTLPRRAVTTSLSPPAPTMSSTSSTGARPTASCSRRSSTKPNRSPTAHLADPSPAIAASFCNRRFRFERPTLDVILSEFRHAGTSRRTCICFSRI